MHYPTGIYKEDALDDVALTADFADNSFEIDLRNLAGARPGDKSAHFNTLTLFLEYQLGAAETNNKVEIQVETGQSDADLFVATASSIAAGVVTLEDQYFEWEGANDAAPYKRAFTVDISDRYLKISVRESGVGANAGVLSVDYHLTKR